MKIERMDAAFHISIPLFFNHLNWKLISISIWKLILVWSSSSSYSSLYKQPSGMFLKFFDWKFINFSGAQAWFSADRTLLISQVLGRKSRTFGEINHENHDCPSKTRLELISRIKISWTILRTKFSSLGNSRWHKTRKFMIHSYLNYFLVHLHIILINSFRFGF